MNSNFPSTGRLRALPKKRRIPNEAFSLIEVVLAIGIVAFAFIALLGLLPVGMKTFRTAIDTSLGAQIGQKVVSDLQESEFDGVIQNAGYTLTPPPPRVLGAQTRPAYNPLSDQAGGTAQVRYFNDQGNEVLIPGLASGSEPTLGQRTQYGILYDVHTEVAWPGQIPAQGAGGDGETVPSSSLALVRVQVISNPAGLRLPPDLTTAPPNTRFTTFSGIISRNGKAVSQTQAGT